MWIGMAFSCLGRPGAPRREKKHVNTTDLVDDWVITYNTGLQSQNIVSAYMWSTQILHVRIPDRQTSAESQAHYLHMFRTNGDVASAYFTSGLSRYCLLALQSIYIRPNVPIAKMFAPIKNATPRWTISDCKHFRARHNIYNVYISMVYIGDLKQIRPKWGFIITDSSLTSDWL